MNKFRSSKKLLSFFLCFLLGFSLSTEIATATNPQNRHINTQQNIDPNSLKDKGKQAYSSANYQQARDFWQQAEQIYNKNRNILERARVISYLALAHYKLGDEAIATAQIQLSRELLASQKSNNELDAILAQVLNNQGIIELALGKNEAAIATWDSAIAAYQRIGDNRGIIQARLNQARGYQIIGLYRRAVDSLAKVNEAMLQEPDSQLKIVALRRYGNMLRLIGELEQSRSHLKASLAIANNLSLPSQQIKTLLALGNTLTAYGDLKDKSYYQVASQHYQKGINLCQAICFDTDLSLRLNLAQLNLLLKTESYSEAIDLVSTIEQQFPQSIQKDQIDMKIGFANSLIELRTKAEETGYNSLAIPSWTEIIALLDTAIANAEELNHLPTASYGWGLQGRVREILSQWDAASQSTAKALQIAQTINAPEIAYLWQWQLGQQFSF